MPELLVPVEPGVDTSIPTGPEVNAKYVLTGPDGTRAVFNDQTDRDFVGMLTEVSGLDSPEVRENADDLVQFDGGIHGDFFYGRRPMTLTGLILNPTSADERNRRMTKLKRASNAMRGDAILQWTLSGGYEQFVAVRRQQPLRIEGAWQKQFQLPLVAADPRIYGVPFKHAQLTAGEGAGETGRGYSRQYPINYGGATVSGQMFVENQGNTTTYPLVTVYGPGLNPVITNFTTGQSVHLTYNIGVGEYLVIDMLNRTVLLNSTASRYSAVDFFLSAWWGLEPGQNDLRITYSSFSTGAGLVVQWRDAWL